MSEATARARVTYGAYAHYGRIAERARISRRGKGVLINDKENEVRKLLKFCGLGWDENCLNPHMNKKIVATASLAQVRTPVYKSSINKWKNLEDELSELKKMIQ